MQDTEATIAELGDKPPLIADGQRHRIAARYPPAG